MAYISVNETARRLGRSIEQVRRYLREGKLRGQRIGGHWFVDEDAVAGWRTGHREATGRIREAAATYEVRPMKTDEKKKRESLTNEELFRQIDEIAEKIRKEYGDSDVVKMLRESRDSH